MAEGERDWTKPAAIALSKEDCFEMERGRWPGVSEDARVPVRLFSETGITTVFTNLEGFLEDWKENPKACVRFVREYQCPSFLEYGEYPYVTADEIKKALRRKAASRTCSTRCAGSGAVDRRCASHDGQLRPLNHVGVHMEWAPHAGRARRIR